MEEAMWLQRLEWGGGKPPEVGGTDWVHSYNLCREVASATSLILDFWPLELWESMFLSFQATQFVVISYSKL